MRPSSVLLFTALLFIHGIAVSTAFSEPPRNCQELRRRYGYIFPHGNRNAASHLWSTHLIQFANQMTPEEFVELNKCYCAVSGSPVNPSEYNRYGLLLDKATNNPLSSEEESACAASTKKVFGFMHYCCWPCVCDTMDYIKADTKTLVFRGGEKKTMHFAVIGDPCIGPGIETEDDLLAYEVPDSFGYRRGRVSTVGTTAPEIHCERSDDSAKMHMQGATFSDHGHPIIAMLFDAVTEESKTENDNRFQMQLVESPRPGKMRHDPRGIMYQHHHEYSQMCIDRIVDGVATSGMGDIFRVLANITTVPTQACPEP